VCAAKKAVVDRVPLSRGRLRKHEFREFMSAVIDAMPSGAESLDAFLSFLRSSVTVSHYMYFVSVVVLPTDRLLRKGR